MPHRPHLRPALAASLALLAAAGPAAAQATRPTAPATASAATKSPYTLPRYDEDFSFLAQPGRRHSSADPVKYVPLAAGRDDVYLSVGGEARLVYEFFDNNAFGRGPQDDDGFLLQRYMLHFDLHVTDALRAFVDLKHNQVDGREGGPRPPDEDRADLHQAFVDLSTRPSDDLRLTLRAGRQELFYGSARLITNRNGPNTRQSFDGVKLITAAGDWRVDAFFARPVETDRGTFDDDADDTRSLWAVYATAPDARVVPGGLDLYYIGYHNDAARFDSGAGDELRHTLGARWFGRRGAVDWNCEGMLQFGTFDAAGDDRDILAWSVATEAGYTFAGAPLSPRLSLRANAISGDGDRDDDSLGTFNALFPRGGYFGEIGVVGPANLLNLHPAVDLKLTRELTLTADCVLYWRYSEDDGLYNAAGALVRPAGGSDARFVGVQPSLLLAYRPTDQFWLIGTYSVFAPGGFIEDTGPDETTHYVRVEAGFRF
jgi:hypothetical protein